MKRFILVLAILATTLPALQAGLPPVHPYGIPMPELPDYWFDTNHGPQWIYEPSPFADVPSSGWKDTPRVPPPYEHFQPSGVAHAPLSQEQMDKLERLMEETKELKKREEEARDNLYISRIVIGVTVALLPILLLIIWYRERRATRKLTRG